MSDETPDTPTTTEAVQGDTPPTDQPVDWQAEAEKWKTHARKHEDRAKANERAVKELEAFKKANQSEQEKALDLARAEGRTEALRNVGGKLVEAEFRAAAAGRITDEARTALLEGLDRSLFLTEDGEVDAAKVSKLLDRIAPKPEQPGNGHQPAPRFDYGQGRREAVPAPKGAAGLAEAQRRFGTPATT